MQCRKKTNYHHWWRQRLMNIQGENQPKQKKNKKKMSEWRFAITIFVSLVLSGWNNGFSDF